MATEAESGMVEAEMEELMISQSQLAREAGVKPSFIKQLINDKRIPEAVRDPEHGNNYRMPSRRCVIPSRYPRRKGKINNFFFRRDEIPQVWITDPETRPGTLDENEDFVGTRLEGEEDELLSERIERTFSVRVSKPEPQGEVVAGGSGSDSVNGTDDLFKEIGIDLPKLRSSEAVKGIFVWLG